MSDELNALAEDIGRIYGKHGRQKVLNFFRGKIGVNNREIPPTGKMRALYNYYRALYPADVPISYSYLRADVQLGNNSEIKFKINESDAGSTLVTERRLNLNDTFEVVDAAIFLWQVPTMVGVPTDLLQKQRLYTYPNVSRFGATLAAALESIYNSGKIIFKLGNKILYDGIDCLRFYRVPTSQEGQVTAAYINSGGVDTTFTIDRDGYSSASYPFDDNVPALTLSGNGKNNYSISLPESVDMTKANFNVYATLWLRGFQCQNGAQQSNKKMNV